MLNFPKSSLDRFPLGVVVLLPDRTLVRIESQGPEPTSKQFLRRKGTRYSREVGRRGGGALGLWGVVGVGHAIH